MNAYAAPLGDIGFVLRHVAGLDDVAALPGLEEATPDVVEALLAEAARLAERVLAPLNQVGDRTPPVLADGAVLMPPGFRNAWQAFADGGWTSLAFPRRYGGQELPRLVSTAAAEIWTAANLSFQNCPLLTQGAIDAILHHGTEAQRQTYATPLIRGEWTGAMCLTEPQAGSDVGALRTRAVRNGDRYRIFGSKIFITFGEHDLASNIVHLVLARIEGAPAGTGGISLFIVPKFLPEPDGRPGRRNDFRCVSLEHKLGLHASPTCIMAYGDGEGAEGFLLGEENRGMRCMFTMMNNARLAVGHQGLGIAERAYQQALTYARTRVQGSRGGISVPIVEHPDVRRMLLTMRAQIAAMRALAYWTAAFVDRSERHPDPAERAAAADRVALLTPLVKAWLTDLGYEIASQAVLVHGGVGYIEETGAAQHVRDARILAIYEGANGIQGMDLVGRKLDMAGGTLPRRLIAELRAEVAAHANSIADDLAVALDTLERTTGHLQSSPPDDRAAGAASYLRLFATVVAGCLLARGARSAVDASGQAWPGLAQFYAKAVLQTALAAEVQILAGAGVLDPALLADR
jgi:alkylation response protein AidB-like acyl-CoA dehydrogenase